MFKLTIMKNRLTITLHILSLTILLFLSGCTSMVRNPMPADNYLQSKVLGKSDLRFWGDEIAGTPLDKTNRYYRPASQYEALINKPHNYLIISGGGENGAFGAGVMTGWSKLGTRPEFTVVTGISTGALTAPFVFLGSKYDKHLEEVYTTLNSKNIFNKRSIFSIFGSDAILDSVPLKQLIEQHIDKEMIKALAHEYTRGRQLLIGTTNLDAGRPVIWNITRIAASKHPESTKLIHEILLASASLPGLFPPVYIKTMSSNGQVFDEMHVDGGVTSQMFFYPADMNWKDVKKYFKIKGTPKLYILRNAQVHPEYKIVEPRVSSIFGKTVESLIRTQGIGDYYRIQSLAKRDGIDVMITSIPKDALTVKPKEPFDPVYMKALFDYGHKSMQSGNIWVESDVYKLLDNKGHYND